MRLRFTGLWRNSDFMKLWGGETISLFGSEVTSLAIPLAAALTLQATPLQMGILGAASYAPFLLVTLFAGVWVDRQRRRPILIWTNIGRAILVGFIPLLALLGSLRIEYLYIIVFLTGVFTVFFDLAYQSFLPSLVQRENLVEANSKLQVSNSAATVSGPGIAGVLVALISAPIALIIDALSFLVSVFCLALIRTSEQDPAPTKSRGNLWHDIGDGMRLVFRSPYLRAFVAEAATYNLFYFAIQAVFVLYITRELKLGPEIFGFITSFAGIGALIGAVLAGSITRRFGVGPTIIGAAGLACLAPSLILFARDSSLAVIVLLSFSTFISGAGVVLANINVISLRQALTPDHLLGRMNASYRLLSSGAIPLGALLGGTLGERIGLWPTLLVCALGLPAAWLWLIFSPLPGLRQIQQIQQPVQETLVLETDM